jgi:Flp pilus assembly protein TadG
MIGRKRHRGQGLIETAIVIPFLVLLLVGIIGFGRLLTASIRLETAAREGARIGGMGGSNADMEAGALKALSQTGNPANIPGAYWMKITPMDQAARTFNTKVTVEIWWNCPVAIPLLSLFYRSRMLYANNIQVVTIGVPPPKGP